MSAPDYRQILLDLFHPNDGHKDGCLFKADSRMPCQCGWSTAAIRYNSALRHARDLAAKHYGSKAEPMAGGDWADDAAAGGLPALWRAIVDHTHGDLFWIGEILLSELTKETGYPQCQASEP